MALASLGPSPGSTVGTALSLCSRIRSPMLDLHLMSGSYRTLFPCSQTLVVSFGCIYLMIVVEGTAYPIVDYKIVSTTI
jgi:hypothetical protein